MQKHTSIYFKESGLDPHGFTPCEICNAKATEIHHIECKGMGGDPTGSKDVFSNLMAVCRICHDRYGDIADQKEFLQEIHNKKFNL